MWSRRTRSSCGAGPGPAGARSTRVEVSTDGGDTWSDGRRSDRTTGTAWAWRRFTAAWDATPGTHLLRARATDAAGRVQPVDPAWNRGGFANNADQAIPAVVAPA